MPVFHTASIQFLGILASWCWSSAWSLSASQPIFSSNCSKAIQAGPQSSASSVESSLNCLPNESGYPSTKSVRSDSVRSDSDVWQNSCNSNSKPPESQVQGNYNKNSQTCTRLRKGRMTEE